MQEELVRMVAQKTGLSEDKARSAAETVIGYLKERLPAPVASQLDSIGTGSGSLGDAAGALGRNLPGRE